MTTPQTGATVTGLRENERAALCGNVENKTIPSYEKRERQRLEEEQWETKLIAQSHTLSKRRAASLLRVQHSPFFFF